MANQFSDAFDAIFKDNRTRGQKIKDRLKLFFLISTILGVLIGVGVLIGKFLL